MISRLLWRIAELFMGLAIIAKVIGVIILVIFVIILLLTLWGKLHESRVFYASSFLFF